MTNVERSCIFEIERVHGFFAAWFGGDTSRRLDEFSSTLAPEFFIVSPDGVVRDRAGIVDLVSAAFGMRSVRISVANGTVRSMIGDAVLATYEEHQESVNTRTKRLSTAVMMPDTVAPHGWRWLAVSETWIDGAHPG